MSLEHAKTSDSQSSRNRPIPLLLKKEWNQVLLLTADNVKEQAVAGSRRRRHPEFINFK